LSGFFLAVKYKPQLRQRTSSNRRVFPDPDVLQRNLIVNAKRY
jgi:hypothetical protein